MKIINNIFKLLLIFLNFKLIFGVNSNYKCVVPKYVPYCQFQNGGLECPTLTDCVEYIVDNFHVETTDLISVLYEQSTHFPSSHCGVNLNIPTSLYIAVIGSYPPTIDCNNIGRFILFNTSFTPYNPWLNITVENINLQNTMYKSTTGATLDGGAISVAGFQPATLYLSGMTMSNSYTIGSGGFVSSQFPIVITNSQLKTGTAIGPGGAIYSPVSVISHGTTYSFCETQGSGGAIFSQTINFMTSSAIANYAQNDGGAISCTSCYMFFSTITENSAGDIGGAVFSMSGMIQIGSVVFKENYAGTCGGALYLINATGSVTTSNFTQNKATYGGALCLVDLPITGAIDFLDSLFSNNIAEEIGGALHIISTQSPNVIYHGIFYNNTYPTLSCDETSQFLCNNNCTTSSCDRCGVSPCLEDYERNFSACFDSTCQNEYELEPEAVPYFKSSILQNDNVKEEDFNLNLNDNY